MVPSTNQTEAKRKRKTKPEPEFFTVRQFCDLTGMSVPQVYRLTKNNSLAYTTANPNSDLRNRKILILASEITRLKEEALNNLKPKSVIINTGLGSFANISDFANNGK